MIGDCCPARRNGVRTPHTPHTPHCEAAMINVINEVRGVARADVCSWCEHPFARGHEIACPNIDGNLDKCVKQYIRDYQSTPGSRGFLPTPRQLSAMVQAKMPATAKPQEAPAPQDKALREQLAKRKKTARWQTTEPQEGQQAPEKQAEAAPEQAADDGVEVAARVWQQQCECLCPACASLGRALRRRFPQLSK